MISIQDIIPFMKDGWVAMDEDGEWYWIDKKPVMDKDLLEWIPYGESFWCCISKVFDIAPADDWTKSLIKVGGK